MPQDCVVYLHAGRWLAGPVFRSNGPQFETGPWLTIDAIAPDLEKGLAIEDALSRSRFLNDDELPDDQREIVKRLLKASGAKNWTAFARAAKRAAVSRLDDGSVTITSFRQDKASFFEISSDALHRPDAEQLVDAVQRAFGN